MNNLWSMEEESLLANVWLAVSECRDAVTERSFWIAVTQKLNDQTDGEHRTKNSIMAQWKKINIECLRYNAIYKELVRTSEDPCRLSNANRIYFECYGKGIYYQHVWFIMRNTHPWEAHQP